MADRIVTGSQVAAVRSSSNPSSHLVNPGPLRVILLRVVYDNGEVEYFELPVKQFFG